jgi:hypothetical protein
MPQALAVTRRETQFTNDATRAKLKGMHRLLLLTALILPLLAGAPMTTLTIQVKSQSGKPVENASVIVKFVKGRSVAKLGKSIRKEWELRTNQEGSVKIPPIPQGQILIQIIAKDYQTFGKVFDIDEENKTVDIALNPPQPQYSAHP